MYFCILSLLLSASAFALDLDHFLKEVKERHPGLRSSVLAAEGAELRSKEAALVYAPAFFANGQYTNDRKPGISLGGLSGGTLTETAAAGFSQQTSWGMTGKLYYSFTFNQLTAFPGTTLPYPSFYLMAPTLELSQPLWRNFFGRETRASVGQGEAMTRALHYAKKFEAKMILAEAEATYWRTWVAQQAVEFQRETLEYAKRVQTWNAERVKLELAERSDLLQAEAAVELRQLDLQGALQEARSAQMAFNLARSLAVDAEIPPLKEQVEKRMEEAPPEQKEREDLLAAREQMEASEAGADASKERNLPQLDLVGSLALNGFAVGASDAFASSLKTDTPTAMVGVKFQTSLGIGAQADAREGYRKERESAQVLFQRKRDEHLSAYVDLSRKLEESRRRYALAQSIEQIQSKKVALERERYKKGKTTTYMVLLFEQEYVGSRLALIRNQAEILTILAQLKTFRRG